MLPFVVVVLVALVAGAAAAVFWSSRPASIVAAPNVVRFTVSPPNNGSWRSNPGGGSIPLAVSPDGRWVVLGVGQGGQEGQGLLWLRSLESPTLRPLAGTEGGRFPFWSPDSRTVAFFTQNALQRVGTTGDGAQRIREVENGRGGAWSADGTIIVSTFGSGLFRTTERGDVFDRLVFSETDLDVRLMAFLPDGRHFLALTGPTASDASAIYLAELGSKTVTRVIDDARGVAYSAGHVLFVRGQTLNALRFDERNLRVVGSPAPIAEGVGVSGNGTASFSASANGVLAHIGAIARPRQLTWRDRSGNRLGSVGAPAFVNTLFLSIDEHLLVTTRQDARSGVQSIWSTELTRNNLDAPIAEGNNAILSPAGDLLVSASPPPIGLQRLALAGSTKPEMLIDRKVVWPTDWSRDGRYLLVFHPEARTNFDVSVFDLVTRKLEPFVRTAADEAQPRFSPDGQWVAYASDLSGRPEIWVRPFGRDGSARRLSPEGGVQPRWRSDGKELYYVAPDRQIMAVALGAWDAETPPTAKALFQARIRGLQGLAFGQDYVPAELGQKFLVAEDVDGSGDNDLTVVLNWPAMVAK
jgi:hypothetical protein